MSNLEQLMQLAELASEEEDPLPSIDPPLIEAVRNPEFRSTVLHLEEKIQSFIKNDSPIIEFPPFHTRYIADIACMLARHYGLEVLSAENGKFGRTPHSRMPLLTLSSIPPFEPERRVRSLNEREEFFKDFGVIINPVSLHFISPVAPHSTSPVHSGLVRDGVQDPNRASAFPSMIAPLSLELLPLPSPEAATPPCTSVPFQNQDVLNFPHPMEDDERNFNAGPDRQRRRL